MLFRKSTLVMETMLSHRDYVFIDDTEFQGNIQVMKCMELLQASADTDATYVIGATQDIETSYV